jgi:ribonuclease HI
MDKFVKVSYTDKKTVNGMKSVLTNSLNIKKMPIDNKHIVTNMKTPNTNIKVEPKNVFTNLLDNSIINVFTDGSCIQSSKNKKNRPAGYACVFPEYPKNNYAAKLEGEVKTNNRAEFMACIKAYEIANKIDPSKNMLLCVHTDSELMINSLTKWLPGWKAKGWKKADGSPVLNVDLLRIMDTEKQKRATIFKHVKAHTGKQDWASIHNDLADKMAKNAALSK